MNKVFSITEMFNRGQKNLDSLGRNFPKGADAEFLQLSYKKARQKLKNKSGTNGMVIP